MDSWPLAVPIVILALAYLLFFLIARLISRRWREKERPRWLTGLLMPVLASLLAGLVLIPLERASYSAGFQTANRAYQQSLDNAVAAEIDTLEAQLARRERSNSEGGDRDVGDRDDVEETLEVLRLKWPAKSTQIEMETRKLIAELGFEPTLPRTGR